MLQAASVLVSGRESPYQQAQIQIRPQGRNPWSYTLFGSDTPDALWAVARHEVDVAIINPSGPLTMAYRGKGPFTEPVPVRAITVIPSLDWLGFAVKESTGITSLADIKARQYPLRVSVRAQMGHSTHLYIDTVLAAYGFSLDDLVSWGGVVSYDPGMPFSPDRTAKAAAGEVEAIFDEALTKFIPLAVNMGMRILPLEESILQKLEEIGFRRATLKRSMFPMLPADVETLDFSGWPVFTREDVSEEFVYEFCRAIDQQKGLIPYQQPGPLPLERMWKSSDDTPLDVPLPAGAERYWRDAGYIK
jgi:TRAP-type uncharacterized transport system substrate-binding protein